MFTFFNKPKKSITSLFPSDYVDIHSHLIPCIDDGSKSIDESITLFKQMRDYGIRNFICTPHIMGNIYKNTPEIILKKQKELQSHLNTAGLTDINFKVAAEYMLDVDFGQLLKKKELLTLKDNKILVEMSYQSPPLNLYEQLFNIQIAGYQPVLAHPERYNFYHHNLNEYVKLKEAGCLFQLNLLSLSTYYGTAIQKTAIYLLKQGFIDFTGSDTHHVKHLLALEKINNPTIIKLITPILENNKIFI